MAPYLLLGEITLKNRPFVIAILSAFFVFGSALMAQDQDKDKKEKEEPLTETEKQIETKLAVDGHWVGVNRGNNYFYFTLDPGMHYFCSQAENHSVLALQVEAGKTYYLQQKITMGLMKARNKLVTVDEAKGKEDVAKTHPSSFETKGTVKEASTDK